MHNSRALLVAVEHSLAVLASLRATAKLEANWTPAYEAHLTMLLPQVVRTSATMGAHAAPAQDRMCACPLSERGVDPCLHTMSALLLGIRLISRGEIAYGVPRCVPSVPTLQDIAEKGRDAEASKHCKAQSRLFVERETTLGHARSMSREFVCKRLYRDVQYREHVLRHKMAKSLHASRADFLQTLQK
jgi:hypothetical protein